MKVLVTGGAGYIGSFITGQLFAAGHEVAILDNLSTGGYVDRSMSTLVEVDLCDRARTATAVHDVAPDAIIHLAALKSPSESIGCPNAYFHNNVVGFVNLLAALEPCGSPPILVSSSCAVYGTVKEAPVGEDAPLSPESPYGESKAICEHAGSTQLVPACVHAALHDLPVPVYGFDYDTPDGTAVRDFVHVQDVATAHVTVLEGLAAGIGSGYFNIGSGSGVSVLSLVRLFEQIAQQPIAIRRLSRRSGDPAFVWAKTDQIFTKYGFRSQLTIEDIVRSEWRWALSDKSGIADLDTSGRVRRRSAVTEKQDLWESVT